MSEPQRDSSTVIDLLRHGEPVGGKRYRGQIDDPLSERGWAQMREAVGDRCPWETILTSPLARCSAFAEELGARHGLSVEADPRWMEIGFGQWEGKTAAELQKDDPDVLYRFWTDPLANRPPGAESLEAFRDRVVAAWEEVVSRQPERHVLVVAHAGVIRMVLRHVLDMPLDRLFRIQVANAGLTRIRVETVGRHVLPRLIFHGGSL
ncbi:MAG: alpha-ribazole phosphatase family protein [Gammaproteobacteria bacterium]